uniref:Wsv269-like protein n=1 Tax=Pasiphaea japonica whispovirus TaxID=2984286 RepID=A0A9C7C9U9_9VIRU|nr:MAG: wsv269-like protein [Pasiphaea japonica whispovirus]
MVWSVRDVKFYTFLNALAEKAKRAKRVLKNIQQQQGEKKKGSINAELGYGGARLMDVRFTGRDCMDELARCLHYCDGDMLILRMVGSSAGNIIVYSLAFLMGVRGACCGYDVTAKKHRLYISQRDLFFQMSGLILPDSVVCACDAVRAISDLFMEVAALQEHPSWHEQVETSSGQMYPGVDLNARRLLSPRIIREMFTNEMTIEEVLAFSEGTAATGFSDLYVEAPIQYVLNMCRAINNMEGRVGVVYALSRYLILFCSDVADETTETDHNNIFYDKCEFYIGSKKVIGDEEYIFTDIVSENLIPLTHLAGGKIKRLAINNIIHSDTVRFNNSMDVLMDSVDFKELVLPILSRVMWQNVSTRLKLRNNKHNSNSFSKWKWDGVVPTHFNFNSSDFVLLQKKQLAADIMTDNVFKQTLPNFIKVIKESVKDGNDFVDERGLICWNYVFELSPLGKHLFPEDQISGFFEASLPLITPWQLKVTQKKRGKKMVVCDRRLMGFQNGQNRLF